MSGSKKYKFLKRKLKTSQENRELHQDMFSDANMEFGKALEELIKKLAPEEAALIRQSLKINIDNKNEKEQKQDKVKPSKKTKEIYRKVANISHPDKTQDKEPELTEKFTKASAAMNEGNYQELYDIAEDLGVDMGPPTEEQIKAIEDQITKEDYKTQEIQKTVAWVWYNTPDEEKELCLMRFLARIKASIS
jgi:hypothetical protein